MFAIHIKQHGEGCDYTIACGQKFIYLPETIRSWDEANLWVKELIKEEYNHDEVRLETVTLIQISDVGIFPIDQFYQDLRDEKNAEEQKQTDAKEREELERLQRKYGK